MTQGKARHSWPNGIPWQVPVSSILSLIGLSISIYLTIVHYASGIPLVCPNKGAIDCQAVITSPQSILFGIPIAVYGDIWHSIMFLVFLPWAWYASAGLGNLGKRAGIWIGYFRFGGILVAISFVIYLIYLELYQIQKICLWCTSVHVTTFLLLITVVSTTRWSLGQGFEPEQGFEQTYDEDTEKKDRDVTGPHTLAESVEP